MTAEVRVTQAAALIELDAQRLQVTQVAALLELDQVQLRATQAAILVEIESADGIIVSGNQVSDCGGAGIQARGAMHTVIASNQVRRCGLGVQGVALQRSLVASNVIELTGGACVRLERSTDNHVSGNVTGMPSAVGPGSASHYELDRRSHRNTVMGNRTLFSSWQAASAVKVAAECAGNAIAFNDFRQLTVNGPLIDDAGASDVMWNLPEATLLAQVRAIVAAMMVGSDTVEVAYDEETGALALSVPAGVVDADAVDGLHGADLLAKGIYDPDDDGKVAAAVQADAVPWSGVTDKPAVYPAEDHTHALGALSDVVVSAPSNGQALVWDSTFARWKPGDVAASGGLLDDLVDVSAASPSNGQALIWDATLAVWRPGTVEGGNGGGGEVALSFDFEPEFPNAIIVPAAVHNGTLIPHDDTTARINSYCWLTGSGSVQTVEIVLRWRLPVRFVSMVGPLKVMSRVSDVFGDCGVEIVEFLDTAGVAVITPSIRRNDGWAEDSFALGAGAWMPGGLCTLRFRLLAKVGEQAYLGPVTLAYVESR